MIESSPPAEYFSNDQVQKSDLPSIEDLALEPVEASYYLVRYFQAILLWGIIFALIFGACKLFGDPVSLPYFYGGAAICCLAVLWHFLVLHVSFPYLKYALREHDLHYQKGWFFRQFISVPFKRIQHVEVTRNPFERIYDLASIKVYTAGSASGDLRIPGLKYGEAEQIRQFILNNNSSDDVRSL